MGKIEYRRLQIIGYILVALSFILWGAFLFVHLLPVSMWWKAFLYTTIVIVAEIFFWFGGIIIGVDFFKRWKSYKAAKNEKIGKK